MKFQKEWLTHLWYRIFRARGSGLLPTPKDTRDYKTKTLGWFGYTPKNQKVFIPPISIKDQNGFNTCQFNATVARKERDEGMPLLVRAFVAYGAKHNYLSGNGWSDMRSGEKILAEWGCPDEAFCATLGITERRPNGSAYSWNEYINLDLDALTENANLHKSKTYWSVSSVNDVLKLLDDGRCVKVAIDWWSAFNYDGGFRFPWIIKAVIGYLLGGHCIVADGYDQNYQNFKVIKEQTSYGDWGDKGHYYITWDLMAKYLTKYGAYTDLDIERSVADILTECAFKNVKGTGTVYYIYGGKKHGYPDRLTFDSYPDWTDADIVKVNQADLDRIPDGTPMPLYSEIGVFISRVKNDPPAKKKLIEIISK